MEKDIPYYRERLALLKPAPGTNMQEALLFLIAELLLEILVEA